ncbi:guanylate kinase [Candidatus Lucifugimonas marina]|uniref:Guanylate kinase n=1 Tax=Candidatus Lucifugimonas marina TaxID=3038979 RepID=A0AAJ6CUN7_9CHLR|nr:guanylate kinase [SAR202 cluster bacterium JH702]MDG0868817.1 guanylate kinase [SAR202 cluster bacterium JH639]WFG36824.1 guanylate kinase [SAR202 cluster bacterium JH545]WFG40762.1 guanylate kinase [SAR202 cluster bacterium JH1073]
MASEARTNKNPLVVVISGPSGVGKDVMIDRMIESGQLGFHFTVTATTRDPRPGEKNGINHHFVSVDDFVNLIAADELLEWAQVYDNYYGVPKKQVRDALASGKHVIMRVDVQGAKRLSEIIPEALLIFIIPPSLEVLRKHLEGRGVNTEEEMTKRLAAATEEISQASLFDFTVTNEEDQLDETVKNVVEIIESESMRIPPRRVSI